MVHQFPLTSRMYFLLLTSLILTKFVVTNERREQEINGSSGCDDAIVNVTDTHCKIRSTVQNNSIFENDAENTNRTKQFETYVKNNSVNVLASSTLSENKDCDLNNFEQKENIIVKCNNAIGNMPNSSVKKFSSKDMLYETMVAIGLFLVGGTVMVLNLIVIVVVFSTPKLRRNTYLNLVLSLSVTDFLFGFSTLFNGIRNSLESISKNGDFCFISILTTSSPLVVSLYQTFLIGFHRYLVIIGSEWGKILFKNRRKYVWYIIGWSIIIVPLSFYYDTLRIENDPICSIDTDSEDRFIIFSIIVIPEFAYMFLVLVFYCLAMRSLKRRYLNPSTSKVHNNIQNNKRQKYVKSMKSVSILLAVMFIFSGPLLVRNVLDLVQSLYVPNEALYLTFALANINSLLNSLIYFTNIVEFKTALRRLCSRPQPPNSSTDYSR